MVLAQLDFSQKKKKKEIGPLFALHYIQEMDLRPKFKG